MSLLEKQVEGRLGGWIQTFSGGRIWPLDPRPEEINIEDIAHALSNLCRFGGHVREFYSVAQHCLMVSCLVPREFALYGLLHDASEAYLIDLPRPIKYSLGMEEYRTAELRLQNLIYKRFGLDCSEPLAIKEADRQMLRLEQRKLMKEPPAEWGEDRSLHCNINDFRPYSPKEAEDLYLDEFYHIQGRRYGLTN